MGTPKVDEYEVKKKADAMYDPPNRPLMSKPSSDKYRENYDKIFNKKKEKQNE